MQNQYRHDKGAIYGTDQKQNVCAATLCDGVCFVYKNGSVNTTETEMEDGFRV